MNNKLTVGMFGSASDKLVKSYKHLAFATGHALGNAGVNLITGAGAYGSMGEISKGFLEGRQHINDKGELIGITTKQLEDLEGSYDNLDRIHIVESMNTRKHMLLSMSDLVLILPGGFGTLDELMEVITLNYLDITYTRIYIVDWVEGPWSKTLNELMIGLSNIGTIESDYKKRFKIVTPLEFEDLIKSQQIPIFR